MHNLSSTRQFLKDILSDAAPAQAMDWLDAQIEKIKKTDGQMKFYLAFSQASRRFSKDSLKLSEQRELEARKIRAGFQPGSWTLLQTARTLLVLEIASEAEDGWIQTLDRLFESADMHEQEALYAALPLLPFPEQHTHRAAEGI